MIALRLKPRALCKEQAVSPPAHQYEIGAAREDIRTVDRKEYWFEAVLFILV
jgi:hypothetical protein